MQVFSAVASIVRDDFAFISWAVACLYLVNKDGFFNKVHC